MNAHVPDPHEHLRSSDAVEVAAVIADHMLLIDHNVRALTPTSSELNTRLALLKEQAGAEMAHEAASRGRPIAVDAPVRKVARSKLVGSTRTILVCVRTTESAAAIDMVAKRLDLEARVRTATSAADALAQLAAFPASIVFADTVLTKPDTVGFTRRVLAGAPHTQLVLFGPEEPKVAQAAIHAGASALIGGNDLDLASTAAKALLLVVGESFFGVHEHGSEDLPDGPGSRHGVGQTSNVAVISDQRNETMQLVASQVTTRTSPTRSITLTERERQVLQGIANGQSNAEIGRDLFVSEDTVKTHGRRLFRKLGARDRAHAVAAAFRAGLVT